MTPKGQAIRRLQGKGLTAKGAERQFGKVLAKLAGVKKK